MDDVSFEEVRAQYLEAKLLNNLPNYQMQLVQQINDANNKYLALKAVPPEMLNIIVQIYNSDEKTGPGPAQNVFTKPPEPMSAGNVGSIFGQPAQNNVMSSGSIFGGSSFGGQASMPSSLNPSNAGSIFGGSSFANQTTSMQSSNTGSLFGAKPAMTGMTTESIFGTPAAPSQSFFGQNTNANSNSMFGNQFSPTEPIGNQQTSIFGAPQSLGQNLGQPLNQEQMKGGFFSSGLSSFPTGQNQSAGIFGQTQVQPAPAPLQQSIFGQPTAAPGFGQSMMQQAQPTESVFAQTTQASIFAHPAPQTQALPPANPFTQASQAMQQNPFQNQSFQQNNQAQVTAALANPFLSQTQQQSAFGETIPDSVYSKMEDLTAEDIEQFNSPEFIIGKLPTKPPCKELCF